MSTEPIKILTYDGLRIFLDKIKTRVLSNYMPLNNYTFEYITTNETTNDIILHVNRANPQLFFWELGSQRVNEPYISKTGPIRAYSMYIVDLSIFTQLIMAITVGGNTQTYNKFTTIPTINEVFERILSVIQPYNWSGYIHYSGAVPTLVFTYWGTDLGMDLDISPSAGLYNSTIGDKYYDAILHYDKIYTMYSYGDQQSLMISGLDLPLGFTRRTFSNNAENNLQLSEDSSFELIQWINEFGNSINMPSSTRHTSIICSDSDNKLIINNNLTPRDNNIISLGDSNYMFSYVHATDFVERGVMLRDTYLEKKSEITYTDIDNAFA